MIARPGRENRRAFLGRAARGSAAGALSGLLAACETSRRDVDAAAPSAGGPVDWERLHRAYGLDPSVLYLNHASIGTIPRAVQRTHARYLELCERNPWLYMWGGAWEQAREQTRAAAAELLGCETPDVALTRSTTEGFNVLAQGLPVARGEEVLFSSLNHPGASICWEHQAQRRGFSVRRFQLPLRDLSGMMLEDVVARHVEAIGKQTRVLVLPHVDNVIGLRHPVAAIAKEARARGVRWVLVDGAQSVSMLPVRVSSLGVDAYATSAHKWTQAPKGTGLLYVSRRLRPELEPMLVTWGQARWQSSARRYEDYGTRALPAVLALGDALRFQLKIDAGAREERLAALRDHLEARLPAHPGLELRSPAAWDLASGVLALGVPSPDPGPLATALFKDHGVVVRPFRREGLSLLRVSPNGFTRRRELERFLDHLAAELA